MHNPGKNARPRGVALMLVLVAMVAMAGAIGLLYQMGLSEQRATENLRYNTVYDDLTEGGTAYAIRQISNSLANYQNPPASGSVDISGVPVTYTITFLGTTDAFGTRQPNRIEIQDPSTGAWSPYSSGATGFLRYVYTYQISAAVNYSAAVGSPWGAPDPSKQAGSTQKIVDFQAQPVFQFLAFWGNNADLEITTGPNALFSGRVHTNKSLYFGNNSYGATGVAQIFNTDYVRAAGQALRSRLDNYMGQAAWQHLATGGDLWIKKRGMDGTLPYGPSSFPSSWTSLSPSAPSSSYALMESKQLWDGGGYSGGVGGQGGPDASQFVPNYSGFDSRYQGRDLNNNNQYTDTGDIKPFAERAMDLWNGTLQTGAMGVQPLSQPGIGSIQAFTPAPGGGFSYNAATKRFVPDPSGTYGRGYFHDTAMSKGMVISSDGATTKLYWQGAQLTATDLAPFPGLLAQKSLWDAREAKNIQVTEIDVAQLNSFLAAKSFNSGLLIYSYREDTLGEVMSNPSNPAIRNGIRLVNGATLRNGMTLASEDPVYVEGDFNTGQNRKMADSNNDQKDDATGTNIANWTNAANKKGAAVISDAVNFLSNSWNDTKTSASGLPLAQATTYNVAVLAGSVPSTPGGAYSGGMENFPRFHEDWSGGRTCRYRGSMVNLFPSKVAMKQWGTGTNVYNPPVRDWNFDTDFQDPAKLPPFTPLVVGACQVVWWR